MQFEKKWHGRLAREDTRKMRVPHESARVPSGTNRLTVEKSMC
jgi:hypothetical protein